MHHGLESPALAAALAMSVGVVAQVLARRLRLPGIVLMLGAGLLLGPDVANVIRPEALGAGRDVVIAFAVAVILFEGGLSLDVRALRRQSVPIRRLVTIGAVITALGGAAAAHLFVGWDLRLSLLFGTLVIVTGPTVITPLLRRVHVKSSVETVLEAEGIFVDAVGATVAVVALEVVLAPESERFGAGTFGILGRFGVGGAIGAACGGALALLLRRRKVLPDDLVNVAVLSSAIAVFQVSNAIVPESGVTAVILAGFVVGNAGSHALGSLREFKEQLTMLLVGTLFVLLAADVRIAEVTSLGVPGLLAVLALVFVVRPLNVLVSTWGTELTPRERAFCAWLAPRGIVAAAVASLFAERLERANVEGGSALRALVFLVIAATVVVQGLSAGLVASLLKVRLPRDIGFAILGANGLARMLGRVLRDAGEEVVLIDTNPDNVGAAEKLGFKVVFGNALDDRTLMKARVETRRACVALTPNESVNFLFAQHVSAHDRRVGTFVALESPHRGVTEAMVTSAASEVLLAGASDVSAWEARYGTRASTMERWTYAGGARIAPTFSDAPRASLLPLVVVRNGIVAPVAKRFVARSGDVLAFAIAPDASAEAAAFLEGLGFVRTDAPAEEGRASAVVGKPPAAVAVAAVAAAAAASMSARR